MALLFVLSGYHSREMLSPIVFCCLINRHNIFIFDVTTSVNGHLRHTKINYPQLNAIRI